jgi:hypothetical protein
VAGTINGIDYEKLDIDAALQLPAAGDAQERAAALESFRDLLGRMDLGLIEQDERDDRAA